MFLYDRRNVQKKNMETLRIKKGLPEPNIDLFPDSNMAVIQYAPMPNKPLRDEFIGDFLVAHVDEMDEIVAVTITDLVAFRANIKETRGTAKRTRDIVESLPNEIIYQINICT